MSVNNMLKVIITRKQCARGGESEGVESV